MQNEKPAGVGGRAVTSEYGGAGGGSGGQPTWISAHAEANAIGRRRRGRARGCRTMKATIATGGRTVKRIGPKTQ